MGDVPTGAESDRKPDTQTAVSKIVGAEAKLRGLERANSEKIQANFGERKTFGAQLPEAKPLEWEQLTPLVATPEPATFDFDGLPPVELADGVKRCLEMDENRAAALEGLYRDYVSNGGSQEDFRPIVEQLVWKADRVPSKAGELTFAKELEQRRKQTAEKENGSENFWKVPTSVGEVTPEIKTRILNAASPINPDAKDTSKLEELKEKFPFSYRCTVVEIAKQVNDIARRTGQTSKIGEARDYISKLPGVEKVDVLFTLGGLPAIGTTIG